MDFNSFVKDRILSKIKETNSKKKIVYPESYDIRTLKAAALVEKNEISDEIIMIGNKDKIFNDLKDNDITINNLKVIDNNGERLDEWTEKFYEIRKHKGIDKDFSRKMMQNELFCGAMLLKDNEADCMVAGAVNTTGNVLRPSIQIIGTEKGIKTVSSSFMMITNNSNFGYSGQVFFADAAVVPEPTSQQLADISISSANLWKKLTGQPPVVALLSFSTKGSAKHQSVDKVIETVSILKERNVDFEFDGELQADAALVKAIGEKKCPGSSVAGKANVLIFPDLNSGNIAYKLVQRLGNAEAYGPLLQGLARPVNDLSRGCSTDDIYNVSAISILESWD